MATCDPSIQELPRCVPAESSDAARDELGACLTAADTDCIDGFCERAPNCYWGPIDDASPRTTRFPPEFYAGASDRLIGRSISDDSYIRGLVLKFLLPGIVIGTVSILFWFVFLVSRYCCCCLWNRCGFLCSFCSPVPKRGGYKKCRQILLPSLLYVLSLIGVIICGALAFVGNEDVTAGITNAFYHSSGLVEDFSGFLERSRVPLVNTQNLVYDAAADASDIFAGTSYVRSTALAIVASLTDFASIHLGGLEASGAEDTFASAIDGFEGQVEPVVASVEGMLGALSNDLTDNADAIQSALTSVVSQVDDINSQSQGWQDDIHSIESQEISLRTYRKLGVMLLFLSGLVATFAGSISILTSKCGDRCRAVRKLLNIAGILCAILSSLTFVVASVSLLVSVLWNDGCQIASLVTTNPSSLEGLIGEHGATVAHAIYNDINLADAFNVSQKLDFQSKLDEGLSSLSDVNIPELFGQVTEPLNSIQDAIDGVSDTALAAINEGTTINNGQCPLNTEYSPDDILEPWNANLGKGSTSWVSKTTGTAIDYSRIANETGTEYLARIYGDIAGICSASNDCCILGDCTKVAGDVCNSGGNCVYPCEALGNAILTGYAAYLDLYEMQIGMTADLGIVCPTAATSCPTTEFITAGHDDTVVDLLLEYQGNITTTADSLVNLATTSVGEIMEEAQALLCEMNVTFVKRRYDAVEREVCDRMLGGFASVNWALWALAVFLQLAAILANMLAIRLDTRMKKDDDDEVWMMEEEEEAVSAQPY